MGFPTQWGKQEAWKGLGLKSADSALVGFLGTLFMSMGSNPGKWCMSFPLKQCA